MRAAHIDGQRRSLRESAALADDRALERRERDSSGYCGDTGASPLPDHSE